MLLSLFPSRTACALLWFLALVYAGDVVSTELEAYGATSQSPYQTFISAPDLKPPELLLSTDLGQLADGYLFIGVDGKPDSTQNVPSIFGQCSPQIRSGAQMLTSASRHVARSTIRHLGLDRD
jgi:hypothetical protein